LSKPVAWRSGIKSTLRNRKTSQTRVLAAPGTGTWVSHLVARLTKFGHTKPADGAFISSAGKL
jgi:hypothetical protein